MIFGPFQPKPIYDSMILNTEYYYCYLLYGSTIFNIVSTIKAILIYPLVYVFMRCKHSGVPK